jgi:hypothetical protein
VGINRLHDGRIVDDLDFEGAKKKASWITSVPGICRELQAPGGTLGQVQHTAQVEMTFTLPEPAAAPLVAKLNEAGQRQMRWLEVDELA